MNDIRSHLICEGISRTYTKWIWHGELPHESTIPHTEAVDVQIGDRIEDMICDLGQEGFWQTHAPYYEKLQTDSKKPFVFGMDNLRTIISDVRFGELEGKNWVE